MEVSVIGSSQVTFLGGELGFKEQLRFCIPRRNKNTVSFFDSSLRWRNSSLRFSLNAVHSQSLRSDSISGHFAPSSSKPVKVNNGVRLFVGLPLDAISECNTINHARAITAGLKALKLLGVEGVEMPVWWGVVEKEAMGKYEWSSYLSLAEMVQNAGLKLHVSLCFHANEQHKIPLPKWVSCISESEPDVFYADRSGHRYKECLSLAVDDLPVLDGKTPVHVYQEFIESFKFLFSCFMDSTISGVTMSLGPDGELRYPHHHQAGKSNKICGVGEFQCYGKNMLKLLKQHAEATGNPLWGLGGPHDAPEYDQFPNPNNFFNDNGGSWESTYGDFFLSWYSRQLLSHGDRLLSLASATFGDTNVYAKVPLVHSWYQTRAHPSELTAGIYNNVNRDGYEAVAEMFARNSCKMILPGLDLSDENQPQESLSSPESLLEQIRMASRKYGVEISGQNSLVSEAPHHFQRIRNNISGKNMLDLFTYQRMGAEFFSPEHFPKFTNFVRSINQPQIHTDDLPDKEEEAAEYLRTSSDLSVQIQTT